MIGFFCLTYLVLGLIDYETCVQYRHWRLWRKDELKPWLNDAKERGYLNPYNYSRANLKKIFETELPEIEKMHDSATYTKRSWRQAHSLKECLKRDEKFDSPYHYNFVDYEMPPRTHPAFIAFEKEQAEKQGIAQLND